MHAWGSGLPCSSAACLLQHLHVLNSAVLIQLLNSCHITLGRRRDSFASMFICNSLAIYTLHIHTGQQGNAAHFSPRQRPAGGLKITEPPQQNKTNTIKRWQHTLTHSHTFGFLSLKDSTVVHSPTLTIKKEKIKYMNHFCNICFSAATFWCFSFFKRCLSLFGAES